MPLEALFKIVSYGILPFWLLLVVAPSWKWTWRLVHSPVVLLLLTPIYAYLLVGQAPSPNDGNLRTLFGVMALFSAPNLVLAGWIHYLIFDLFVGAWEARDAKHRGIPHAYVVPCLVATLVAGPVGFSLYVVMRFVSRRELEYDETTHSMSANGQ